MHVGIERDDVVTGGLHEAHPGAVSNLGSVAKRVPVLRRLGLALLVREYVVCVGVGLVVAVARKRTGEADAHCLELANRVRLRRRVGHGVVVESNVGGRLSNTQVVARG